MRRVWTLAVLTATACGSDITPVPETPDWVGTYALLADSSRTCQEVQDPGGRRCECATSGYYEGTLSLTADDTGGVAGTLSVAECRPDRTPACGPATSHAVGPFSAPPLPPGIQLPAAWLRFCASGCPYAANRGWNFTVPSRAVDLAGHYARADGNIRACGDDQGPFIAVKQ